MRLALVAPLYALLLTSCGGGSGSSVSAGPGPIETEAQRVRQIFDLCVYSSFGNFQRSSPSSHVSLLAEQAFAACATEENAMMALAANNGASRSDLAQLQSEIRMQVKATIYQIAPTTAR